MEKPGNITPPLVFQPRRLESGLQLQQADPDQRQAIVDLLNNNGLPVSDIDASVLLFALINNKRVVGAAGLEIHGSKGLLRSVCLEDSSKGRGWGMQLCREMEHLARHAGIDELYLVTTSAAPFFEKLGYSNISRQSVPAAVLSSAQFNGICPASATIMAKHL